MTSSPEAMGWEFGDFEKVQLVVEWGPVELVVDLDHVDGQLKLG